MARRSSPDPIFAAQMAAAAESSSFRERNRDFPALWAERLARGETVPSFMRSNLHMHTAGCFEGVPLSRASVAAGTVAIGRVCNRTRSFVVDEALSRAAGWK